MKIQETKLYSFEELSREAKETAIESNRYLNVEHEEWWEFAADSITSLFATVGLDVTLKYFCLDRNRGASCDVEFAKPFSEVVKLIDSKAWKQEFPTIDGVFSNIAIDAKGATASRVDYFVGDLIYGGIKPRNGRCVGTYSDAYVNSDLSECPRILDVCSEIIGAMESLASDIDSLATKWLEEEFDYLTSDECIAAGLHGTGEIFLETGDQF